MLRIWGFILFMLLTGCATTSPDDREKALLHLKIGTAHLNKGNYPAALSELLQAEKLHSDNPVIQNNLGLAYFVRNKFAKAEQHIRKAIELEPKYTEARNNLGRVLIEQGLYDLAIKELKVATEDLTYQIPEKSHSNLGLAYFKKGNYESAMEQFKKALSYDKSKCLTFHYYARTLFETNHLHQASQAFDQAISVCENQKFEEPFYYSALSYYRLGQREEAVARFKEMLAAFPQGDYAVKARELLRLMK